MSWKVYVRSANQSTLFERLHPGFQEVAERFVQPVLLKHRLVQFDPTVAPGFPVVGFVRLLLFSRIVRLCDHRRQ